jgi:hypothetical protein
MQGQVCRPSNVSQNVVEGSKVIESGRTAELRDCSHCICEVWPGSQHKVHDRTNNASVESSILLGEKSSRILSELCTSTEWSAYWMAGGELKASKDLLRIPLL